MPDGVAGGCVYQKLARILKAAGAGFEHVVSTRSGLEEPAEDREMVEHVPRSAGILQSMPLLDRGEVVVPGAPGLVPGARRGRSAKIPGKLASAVRKHGRSRPVKERAP